jgi:hypothetical protein
MATAIHHGMPHAHVAAMTAAHVPTTGIQHVASAIATATSRLGFSERAMNAA